jgi:hypothetical protein
MMAVLATIRGDKWGQTRFTTPPFSTPFSPFSRELMALPYEQVQET